MNKPRKYIVACSTMERSRRYVEQHCDTTFSSSENGYMGWDSKTGNLYEVRSGNVEKLRGLKFKNLVTDRVNIKELAPCININIYEIETLEVMD